MQKIPFSKFIVTKKGDFAVKKIKKNIPPPRIIHCLRMLYLKKNFIITLLQKKAFKRILIKHYT